MQFLRTTIFSCLVCLLWSGRRPQNVMGIFSVVVLFVSALLPQATRGDDVLKVAEKPADSDVAVLVMENGDKLSGVVISATPEILEIETRYAGRISIRVTEIKSWQTANTELQKQFAGLWPMTPQTAKPKADDARIVSARKPGKSAAAAKPEPWKRTVSFAYTLTRGNVNLSDLNGSFNISRKRGSRRIALNSFGRYGVQNGKQSAQLLSSTLRYERTVAKLPAFFESAVEIDKLKNLDYRASQNIGLTYPVRKGETSTLSFDFGTGLTREDYETGLMRTSANTMFRVTAAQKLYQKAQFNQQATVFSDLLDPNVYRVQAEAALTTPITKSISLKLAGINRFDSRPQGTAKPNDFTVLTGFTFNF